MAKGKNKGAETDNSECSVFSIVFTVHLHCKGCTGRIRKHILKYPGVVRVEFEGENKVKVICLKNVDPEKLRDKLQEKTSKKFELILPQQPKKDAKQNVKQTENKPKELAVTSVLLKVEYHCDGCYQKLCKTLHSYTGVHEVKEDKEKSTMKVSGRFEVKKMVEELSKKLHKPLEIIPEKEKEQKKPPDNSTNKLPTQEKNKEVKVEYLVNGSGYVGVCDGSGRILKIFDTPELFSDDNPNGCFIM
ncbi:heavy metal-associated isoprenylated plant protein 3-like [Amaranthus tricolor]|uniref:heavy metal-associated isoprenylated plant protein 3-like n=1 Tax=Amaranthus tricolor TaxID=29722 RepID=UPI002587E5A3|nr:heavy metal-associated isoprenylated plant protein 3-like [Amaranthus tricolor]